MAGSTAPALLLLALASTAGLLPATGSAEIEVDVILPDRLEAHPSELFRINLLALRDPHVFIEVEPIPGFPICVDATDPLTPDAPSFNGVIDQAINLDDDGDGFLDASPLLVLQPRGWPESPGALALVPGVCTAPAESTTCETVDPFTTRWFDSLTEAVCRAPLPGTVTGYTPAVPSIEGPCFATHPAPLSLAIEALPFNLEAATISASWTAVDTGVLGPGLLRGFLSQEDAEAIIFPDEIEVIGGQTLASLLAGGPGNCATESDLDQFGGVDGWWFYFEIEAARPAAGD